MMSKKFFYIYLYILFLTNFSFIFCIIEIPLHPIYVESNFKHNKLITTNSLKSFMEDEYSYYDIGNAEINKELIFTARFKLGSESQSFNLLLDTGSYAMWVAQKDHNGTTNITNFYDPNISETSVKTDEKYIMLYGTGLVIGLYYYDSIEYIPNKVSKIKFGVGSNVYFTIPEVDGIIGLGREYEDEETSFITSLKKNGHIDARAFSVKFEGKKFIGGIKGSMFIGIHDDFYKNETVSCPLVLGTKTSWKANITSFGLKNNKSKVRSQEFEAPFTFDTGTNIIYIPKQYFLGIKNDLDKFDCEIVYEKNRQRYKCKEDGNYPDLEFKINGHIFTIPKEDAHFEKPEDKGYLYSKAIYNENYLSFIMGSCFFFNFHTLFDMDGKELKFYPVKKGILYPDSPDSFKPTDSSKSSEKKNQSTLTKKLSAVEIIFIVTGCIVFVIAIALIVYFVVIKQKKNKEKEVVSETVDNSEQRLFKEEE